MASDHRSRGFLIGVWNDTKDLFEKYPHEGTTCLVRSKNMEDLASFPRDRPGKVLGVVDLDCIVVAERWIAKYQKVALINMASCKSRGGGVITGARAQEEHLCRTSNLYQSLLEISYPFDEDSCILSTDVEFFKGSDYAPLPRSYCCDVVSVSALRMNGNPFTKNQEEITKRRIRLLLACAVFGGNKHVILSALGCGAYGNDPVVVARLFKTVLMEEGFARYFDKVVFAIIDDHNSKGNLASFVGEFKQIHGDSI